VASYGEHDIAGVAGWFGPGTALLHTFVSYPSSYVYILSR
jgi:hypothetical protein